MYLKSSGISCGINELVSVGTRPTDNQFAEIMRKTDHCAVLIASVPTRWKNAVKFLKRNGFKQVNREITNPNTKNKIALFSRNVTEKDRAAYYINYCNCGVKLPNSRRQVCDACKKDACKKAPRYPRNDYNDYLTWED